MAPTAALVIGVAAATGTSCIIPDKGIVASVDCGVRWCATAEYATALDGDANPVHVQTPQPDGSSGWVTACVCMTPAEDVTLRAGVPPMQYELLRNQVLDAARQACLDAAYDNALDPDPPYPLYENLDPSCFEAVTSIFRDGCCAMLNTECGTIDRCDADLDPTGGEPGTSSGGPDSADTTAADSTGQMGQMGQMSSLEPFYAEVTCEGTTCEIGQPLIDAALASPEAVLAEGTSLAFASAGGKVVGLEIQGVERDGLAGRLGLRDGDVLLRVDELPLRDESELLAAVDRAYRAERVTVLVERDGVVLEWMLVRAR